MRLGPAEGLAYRQVGATTRPFVVLRPGEAIRERVSGRGGQLAFAWTVSGGRRQVRLEVTLDGKTLYTGRGTGTETWQEVTLPVEPGRGDAQLELRAFRRGASAELLPAVAVTCEGSACTSGQIQGIQLFHNLQGPGGGTPWVTA